MLNTEWKDIINCFSDHYPIDFDRETNIMDEVKSDCTFLNDMPSHAEPHSAIKPSVRITHVSTLVCRGSKMPNSSFVVPTWASHWGIIIDGTLFHLQYQPRDHKIVFTYRPWDEAINSAHRVQQVGTTRLSFDQIRSIGKLHSAGLCWCTGYSLIYNFGNYHLIFWNCQAFAKLFLGLVCEEKDAKFNEWSAGDTTNLVTSSHAIADLIVPLCLPGDVAHSFIQYSHREP